MNRKALRQQRARERLLASTRYEMTEHAAARARELGYALEDVIGCVAKPDQSYPGGPSHPHGRRIHQRKDLAVVLDEVGQVVVTVLPRTTSVWEHGRYTRATLFGGADRIDAGVV